MKQQLQAEVQILDRVMHLLEENSVLHLAQADKNFADYIDELYVQLQNKSSNLHRSIS